MTSTVPGSVGKQNSMLAGLCSRKSSSFVVSRKQRGRGKGLKRDVAPMTCFIDQLSPTRPPPSITPVNHDSLSELSH